MVISSESNYSNSLENYAYMSSHSDSHYDQTKGSVFLPVTDQSNCSNYLKELEVDSELRLCGTRINNLRHKKVGTKPSVLAL